jgi:hypothetical protein
MLREVVAIGGWIILWGSLFLFLLSLYMVAKVDFRKEWQSLVAPLELSFIGLFFYLGRFAAYRDLLICPVSSCLGIHIKKNTMVGEMD